MAHASLDDPKRLDHPVWMVYNLQRTACLNAKYYGHKLRALEFKARWIDVIIAVSAPTSGVAGLALWQSSMGKEIWTWTPAIATLLIVWKAATKTTAKLKELEKRVTAYQSMLYDLKEISDKVLAERKFSTSSQKLYEAAQKRYGSVFRMPPDEKKPKLEKKFREDVLREMPADSFFIPEE